MKIVICLKRVPDTSAKIKVASDGKSIDLSGVQYVINPYDEYALEGALRVKDAQGSEVTVVSLGSPDSTQVLRQALAMGAGNAILIRDNGGLKDPFQIAHALTGVLQELTADLHLFGTKAVDDDYAQVGSLVARFMKLPIVTNVVDFEVKEKEGKNIIQAHREVEGGVEVLHIRLPAVCTCHKAKYEPRYASLKGIMMAKSKPLQEKTVMALPAEKISLVRFESPPARPAGRIVGQGAPAVSELVRLLHEEAKIL